MHKLTKRFYYLASIALYSFRTKKGVYMGNYPFVRFMKANMKRVSQQKVNEWLRVIIREYKRFVFSGVGISMDRVMRYCISKKLHYMMDQGFNATMTNLKIRPFTIKEAAQSLVVRFKSQAMTDEKLAKKESQLWTE